MRPDAFLIKTGVLPHILLNDRKRGASGITQEFHPDLLVDAFQQPVKLLPGGEFNVHLHGVYSGTVKMKSRTSRYWMRLLGSVVFPCCIPPRSTYWTG